MRHCDAIRLLRLGVLTFGALAAACATDDSGLPVVGTLERDRLELVAEAHEPITEILVREGDSVVAGDVLVRQELRNLEAQVAQAIARRDRATARLAEQVRGPRRELIIEAQATLEGAESRLETAEREYDRVVSIVEQGLLNESASDQAYAERETARAARAEAEARLRALLEGTTVEELDQARAELAEADAVLATLQISLERLTIRAPVDGLIEALPFETGERPRAGAVLIVMLAARTPYARVYVPAPLRTGVRAGLAAKIYVDGYDRSFDGRVRYISSEAAFTPYLALTERDRSRLSYLAEVDLVDPDGAELPTGIPVEVDFPSLAR